MVEIQIAYQGKLRCQATHGPSGVALVTDAPKDNMGEGQSFSPTDLVATAMGTCMLTTMGIAAQKMQVDLRGTSVTVTKEMTAVPSRRIARLGVTFNLPVVVSDEQREKLEYAAINCPVQKSVHPEMQVPVVFNWGK